MTLKLKDSTRTEEVIGIVASGIESKRMRVVGVPPKSTALVATESRYAGHQVVIVRIGPDQEFKTLETWEKPAVPAETGNRDKYFFVDAAYSYRSDLISNAAFGTPLYNWWILVSNNMYDDAQLTPGTTLRIVSPPSDRIRTVARRPF